MDYEEFFNAVARRLGVSSTQAASVTSATLKTLAERISGGEARRLAEQLPRELREYLSKPRESAEPFGLGEFVRRVSERAGVDTRLASDSARAVLRAVSKDVNTDEFEDMVSQLPEEFSEVLEPVAARAGIPRRGRR